MVKTSIDYAAQISPEEARRIITAASAVYDPEKLKGIFDSPETLAYAAMELEINRRYAAEMYGHAGSALISLTAAAMQKRDKHARERDFAIIDVLRRANLP